MSSDAYCGLMSDQISCKRQYELAKIQADQETSQLKYMLINPSCTRMTQLADRTTEHSLTLGRTGVYINNPTRVTPQVSILDYPNRWCKVNKPPTKN